MSVLGTCEHLRSVPRTNSLSTKHKKWPHFLCLANHNSFLSFGFPNSSKIRAFLSTEIISYQMEFTKESESLLDKIRPPRLEDAGLEDCALPPESIKEAFLKAATAVRSIISASGDEDESQGQCVKAPSPNDDFTKDALIGITEGITDIPGKCNTEKGGGGEVPEGIIDVVDVQGGSKDSDDRGDLVDGLSLPEGGESCVDGLQGLEIGEKGGKIKKKEGKEEDEEASDEKPTLVEGFV
ncbi:hypothetical protein P3S68_005771 [Capsicum galapagoense]